jgi:spermidine synthase
MTLASVPRRYYTGLFVISAATLLLELTLTRIFDFLLWANLSYLVVSSAMFGFGLGGIALMLWPAKRVTTDQLLTLGAAGFSAGVLVLLPVLMYLPLNLENLLAKPAPQLVLFLIFYLALLFPFFASGLTVSAVLSRNAACVHRLYFWDLVGAGLGCFGIFGLPRLLGAEATLLLVAGAGGLSAVLFAGKEAGRTRLAGPVLLAAVSAIVPLSDRISFRGMDIKRGVDLNLARDRIEFTRWDPVSRIDVLREEVPWRKRIAYNGGSQSSSFYAFDGDYAGLRHRYFDSADSQPRYNSGKYVALCHWLKRDQGANTLVIGSAGGQETLAALTWGASHVDAIEMVGAVIEAGTGPFASFIGNIFHEPRVSVHCDEGRSFLRHGDTRYDVIQIHSNHTTSSIANGAGGTDPIYLQTVEAYKDYITHLTPDGILQINYFVYPRMIATAARAWAELFPGEDVRQHVVVTSGFGAMATFLLKRSPWTHEEIGEVRRFLYPEFGSDPSRSYRLIYAAGEPEEAAVPRAFFEVPLPPSIERSLPYAAFPTTDDRPFFRDLRRGGRHLEPDAEGYVSTDTAEFLNGSLRGNVPMERVHVYVLGGLSLIASILFVFVPLFRFKRKGLRHAATLPALAYFSCLGSGFVLVEITLILKFVLVVGSPIHAMAAVLFTMLVFAGIGSWLSERALRSWGRCSVLVVGFFGLALGALILGYGALSQTALGLGPVARILLAAACIAPVALPLGMPFPLGIAALNARAPQLVPWAWGVNGFMTVIGSLAAVMATMALGFDATLLLALGIYAVAAAVYPALCGSPIQAMKPSLKASEV